MFGLKKSFFAMKGPAKEHIQEVNGVEKKSGCAGCSARFCT